MMKTFSLRCPPTRSRCDCAGHVPLLPPPAAGTLPADMEQDRCIQGLESLPPAVRGCVLTIGNFDGVHVGHRRILLRARELAGRDAPVVALTFDPPPDLVLRPSDKPQRLTTLAERRRLLLHAGADHVVTAAATAELLALESEAFIREVIEDRFAPRGMVEGPDFHFGRGRGGSVDTLRCRGFDVRVVEPVAVDLPDGRQIVSSTLIRRLLLAGGVEDAARCLDRLYTLQGRVVGGRGVGRVLEFPTANLDPREQVVPADGVYAGWAAVGTEMHAAAISIGDKPTFHGEGGRAVEAFLLGAAGNYYGREMTLSFARRLRDQERFPGVGALKAQIARDVENVRAITRQ